MSVVRIPLKTTRRGNHTVFRYEFRLGVYPTPAATPLSLPCLIDTAYEFTTVPQSLLMKSRLLIPRLGPADQVSFQNAPRDYLGFFWYGFRWNSDTAALAQSQFRCEQCRVTQSPLSHIHFALRDLRLHFDTVFDHARSQLLLTLRPGNQGYPVATP